MGALKSGVLVKLLEDIKSDNDEEEDQEILEEEEPVLLQIRSIIPVLEEGNLWPNKGFYLKVSDLSHSIYVSLPQDENEMVLNNKLRLGQFIYVSNLEKSQPFSLLKGISPVPGRHPWEGYPEDILSPTTFSRLIEISNSNSDSTKIVEKGVISEKKFSDSRNLSNLGIGLSNNPGLKRKNNGALDLSSRERVRSLSASKSRPSERIMEGLYQRRRRSSSSISIEEDSDSDCTLSSSGQISKRKSWTSSEILGVKDIFYSSVIKHEIRPPPRSHSATASPVRSVRYDSSDDNSNSTTRRRDISSTKKLVKGTKKMKNPTPKLIPEQASSHRVFSTINDKKQAETAISWSSLPLRLAKLGKEVVRQRDVALSTAADAVQEACAAERLLNSLNTYSEFIVAEGDDMEPYVDKFFDLQDELRHTKLIMQSLTNITIKTSETDTCGTASVKEALKIALERKKDAASWIKTAVALDLSPCSMISPNPIIETHHPVKKAITSNRASKPKGTSIIKRNRTSDDISSLVMPSSDRDNHHAEWERGGNLSAATDLVSSLQDQCRKLFLEYVEKYLDEVERKISSIESDGEVAGIMYKVKRVSDWLDVFISKVPNSAGQQWCTNLDEPEMEAYGRVRNKIYGMLLKHVERTAMALETITASM